MDDARYEDICSRFDAESVQPPDPLRRAPIPAEPYPVEALGAVLGPALEAIRSTVQAPVPLIAQSLLGAAALAAQPHANVIIDGRVMPISLFMITIGASGERKTGVDTLVLKPIQARQRELVDAHQAALTDHKIASRIWEQAEAAAIKEKVVDLSKVREGRRAKAEALKELGDQPPEPPLLPNLLVGDPTSEGLFKLFANGQPSLSLFSDEGALFVGGHAMARDARLRTIGALSKLWDGRPLDRVRGGDGASILYDRRLSLHLMMQPLVAAELFNDPIYADQGFLARVLLSWPDSTAGTRLYVNADPYQDARVGRYWRALTDLLYRPPSLREGTRNELIPRPLPLSPSAKAEWVTYFDGIEAMLGEGGKLESIRGFASKAAEHAARLSGVLALIADPNAAEIDQVHIQSGIWLMDHYLTETLRIQDAGIADPDLQLAQRLLEWLHGLGEAHTYLAKVYQFGPNGIRDAKTARKMLEILEKHRWVYGIEGGLQLDGAHRKEVWKIVGKEAKP
ncbi:MAG: YfjI family protein [Candidatus Competibacter sp.]